MVGQCPRHEGPVECGGVDLDGRRLDRGWRRRGGERLDAGAELGRGREAQFRGHGQRSEDHLVESDIDLDFSRRGLEGAFRRFPGEQFVQHHPQRVDVGAMVHGPAGPLFRGHVLRRACGRGPEGVGPAQAPRRDLGWCRCGPGREGATGRGGPEQLGDAEIGHFHPALLVEQQVLRLDVAVHHAVVVGVLERFADRRHDGQRLFRGEPAGRHRLAQVDPVDVLHHQVVEPARLAEIVDGDDVRVVQRGQHPGLRGEPLGEAGVGAAFGGQDLEGHHPAQGLLPGLVHHPHAAAAEALEDLQLGEMRGEDRRAERFRGRGGRLARLRRGHRRREEASGTGALRGGRIEGRSTAGTVGGRRSREAHASVSCRETAEWLPGIGRPLSRAANRACSS